MKITVKSIKALNPCKERFQNFKSRYPKFSGTGIDFLSLDGITATDKIWVLVRILPREIIEVFAIDCAFSAAYAAYAAYAASTASATVYAASAANAAAASAANAAAASAATSAAAADSERERQVDCLIYLCETMLINQERT